MVVHSKKECETCRSNCLGPFYIAMGSEDGLLSGSRGSPSQHHKTCDPSLTGFIRGEFTPIRSHLILVPPEKLPRSLVMFQRGVTKCTFTHEHLISSCTEAHHPSFSMVMLLVGGLNVVAIKIL